MAGNKMNAYLNMDRRAMKDPATSHLRIYVGNLTDHVTVDLLYEYFIGYGQINGIALNKGFGFIQFEQESSVHDAIQQANGSSFQGKSLSVKTALVNTDKTRHDTDASFSTDNTTGKDKAGDEQYDSYGNFIEQGYKDDSRDVDPFANETFGEDYEEPMQATPTPRGGGGGAGHMRGEMRGRGRRGRGARGRGAGFSDRPPPPPARGEWNDRNYERFQPALDYQRPVPVNERNDCEIIVVSKALTEYAEYIEGRLKRLGIVVDLLFPIEDVTIGKVLGNIASRGCLYAILVMPQNQEHRSLTLTMLHGLPQEHRNMPLEDALQLLSRNYQEVQRGGGSGREAVYALLGQLADGRTLTVLQYDKVIEYLQERREQQVKVEVGEPLATSANKDKTHVELQQRILSILNDKKMAPSPVAPVSAPAPATQSKLLNDPTVRLALDSILQKFH